MLPRRHRMTDSHDFSYTVRHGRRARRGRVLAYLARECDDRHEGSSSRVGLIVSSGVGPSVTRHRVSRVLRHVMAERLEDLSQDNLVVIRALPSSGKLSGSALARDLNRCLDSLLGEET